MSFVDRIRALPVVGQIALAGVTALLIVGLVVGAWVLTRPKYEVLFRDLRPTDAATIVAQLEKDKTPYRLDDGGATILAPAAHIDETRLAIMGADLPLKGTVGFELFNKSDMGLTEFAQRINYQRALQGELARTIMTIDAVDTARVHLTLPEPSIFRADRKPAKASVTLTTRPGRTLTPETVAGIQRLVGASVPELDVANVVVLNAQGSLVAGAPVEAGTTIDASATVQQTRAIEQFYAGALRRALEPLYPGLNVNVLVPVEQWAVEGEGAREMALARWTPNGRDFRLQIEVSARGGLETSQRDDIGQIVQDETGWSAERGDVLLFTDRASDEIVPAPHATVASPSPVPEESPTRLTPKADLAAFGWGAAVLAALVFLVLVFARRQVRRGALTEAQREAYVRRLRRLLAEDAGHAG